MAYLSTIKDEYINEILFFIYDFDIPYWEGCIYLQLKKNIIKNLYKIILMVYYMNIALLFILYIKMHACVKNVNNLFKSYSKIVSRKSK